MKDTKILNYAYHGALDVWAHEKEILDRNPANEIAQCKERKRWDDLEEIRRLYMEAEEREKKMAK